MQLLHDGGEHCACELIAKLDATQSRLIAVFIAVVASGILGVGFLFNALF